MSEKRLRFRVDLPLPSISGLFWSRLARALVPNLGTVIVVGALLFANNAIAGPSRAPSFASSSTTTISYQGRLLDNAGNPINSTVGVSFRLYPTDTGGSPLWNEDHLGVPVQDGLFHVLLGSTNPIPVSLLAANSALWLGVQVGGDSEMTPREQIASVPYAMIANTVADGSITAAKLAPDVLLGLSGWERDESSTSNPTNLFENNLIPQHGYAQYVATSSDVSLGYFDHLVTFATPYKAGTVPTVVFTYGGESGTASDVPKGGHTNGAGANTGRLFWVSNTGFTIRASATYADRRMTFYWTAIGQKP